MKKEIQIFNLRLNTNEYKWIQINTDKYETQMKKNGKGEEFFKIHSWECEGETELKLKVQRTSSLVIGQIKEKSVCNKLAQRILFLHKVL